MPRIASGAPSANQRTVQARKKRAWHSRDNMWGSPYDRNRGSRLLATAADVGQRRLSGKLGAGSVQYRGGAVADNSSRPTADFIHKRTGRRLGATTDVNTGRTQITGGRVGKVLNLRDRTLKAATGRRTTRAARAMAGKQGPRKAADSRMRARKRSRY